MVVVTKQVQKKCVHSEILKLKEENEKTKNKITVLKQSNKNTTTSTNDLVRSKYQKN